MIRTITSSLLKRTRSSSAATHVIHTNNRRILPQALTVPFSSTSSTPSSFDNIGVIGLGLMGHGICQVSALSKSHQSVIAYESSDEFLDRGKSRIEASLQKLVSKHRITQEDYDDVQSRIHYTTNIDDLSNVDFVVEAVVENMDLKKELYTNLNTVCKPETIFASNTSSLSITEMAVASNRAENFVGMHFFNPVQIMKLVEVIRTEHTNTDVYDKAYQWVHDIHKVPVSCGDTPGFIVNRLLVPGLIQAMCMVDRGDASLKDIDLSMQLGAGHPMGPLHLADYIGLDTCYFIVEGWVKHFPEERAFVMPECLKEMVDRGDYGRKTGKGFYVWEGDKRGDPVV